MTGRFIRSKDNKMINNLRHFLRWLECALEFSALVNAVDFPDELYCLSATQNGLNRILQNLFDQEQHAGQHSSMRL